MKPDIAAIRARAEAATAGRWQAYAHDSEHEDIQGVTAQRAARVVSAWLADRARRGILEPEVFQPATPGALRSAAPRESPPQSRVRGVFSRHTPWEEFEYGRVAETGRVPRVPGGPLFTGGRAWRREVTV